MMAVLIFYLADFLILQSVPFKLMCIDSIAFCAPRRRKSPAGDASKLVDVCVETIRDLPLLELRCSKQLKEVRKYNEPDKRTTSPRLTYYGNHELFQLGGKDLENHHYY